MKFMKWLIINSAFSWVMYKALTTAYPSTYSVVLIILILISLLLAFLMCLAIKGYPKLSRSQQKILLASLADGVQYTTIMNILAKIYDALATAVFLYFGWWVVGTLYFIHFIAVNYITDFTIDTVGEYNENGE